MIEIVTTSLNRSEILVPIGGELSLATACLRQLAASTAAVIIFLKFVAGPAARSHIE
jgi:hypothetical protein